MLSHADFGSDLIVILGDIDYIGVFTESRVFNVVIDGTFKSSPSIFQIYIIHGVFAGQSFLLIYCFLNAKTERLYTKVFTIIRDNLQERNVAFEPDAIKIDFKKATFNILRTVFPLSQIRGCFTIFVNQYGDVFKN
ncbi:hypothetical protein DMUE_6185 [Dictyocoela muelleri]|nr:hypothetical protein DMUE_6185 [Dictyocoela muelleri]